MPKICALLFILLTISTPAVYAQDATTMMKSIQVKLDKINDYEASAELKTEISFLKVPDAVVKIFYKKPDKIKIKNEKGELFNSLKHGLESR